MTTKECLNISISTKSPPATTVAQAMTSNPATVHPITGIDEIASLMVDKNFHTVPVVEEGSLVGIVGKEDILSVLM